MPKRIAVSTLNASTLDILNTIRENASYEYQNMVPVVAQSTDIPKVGEIIMGYPSLANQFINSLMNRIAFVAITSKTFNNPYEKFKKGYLTTGEVIEEVFVELTKVREFSVEKAEAREFKRSLPDVRTAFHAMNWRVQYPITIQDEDLRMAFTSLDGVTDLIARIINQVYVSAAYDEFLLFKYLIIKAVAHGKMHPVGIDTSDIHNAAVQFRAISNGMTFMSTQYNAAGVHTITDKADQYIFMDASFNAQYDVNVLSAAFNMDKADFMGKLELIDDWTTFDNERFAIIRANSTMIEEVTDAELQLMAGVKAVLLDKEWFQVYDNLSRMSDKPVASGLYWNYFYNAWKTVSSSPFSNAVVFVDSTAMPTNPATITATVASKDVSEEATVITLSVSEPTGLAPTDVRFLQTSDAVTKGVAVHPYGVYIFPAGQTSVTGELTLKGTKYIAASAITTSLEVGDTVTFAPED